MPGFGGFTSAAAYMKTSTKPKDTTEKAGQKKTFVAPPDPKREPEANLTVPAKRQKPAPFFKPSGFKPAAKPGGGGKPTPSNALAFKPSDPSLNFADWPDDEKEQFKAKKRAQEEKALAAKADRQKHRQGSIFGAFAKAAEKGKCTGDNQRVADSLPIQIKQRILANVPAQALGDARLISTSWCAAVDDPTFQRFAKMAAHCVRGVSRIEGMDDETTAASTSRSRVTARRVEIAKWMVENGAVDAAGVVSYLASSSQTNTRPFKTPLTCDALVQAVIDMECVREKVRFRDVLDESVSVSDAHSAPSGPAPGAGLAQTLKELKTWRLPNNDGWALLALAVFTAVETATTMSFLFQAAETAGRKSAAGAESAGVVAEFCPRQDLDEFASFLVAAMSSESWRRGDTDSDMPSSLDNATRGHVHTSRLARLAQVTEAVGTIELSRARMVETNSRKRSLTHEQLAVVSGELAVDQVMLVMAFAGTGKTTTLLEYVKRRPGHTFAYLTFNRAIMEEAKSKFPKNTKALSFHGLAFRKFGFVFKDKMFRGTLRAHHAMKALGLDKHDDRAILAIRTLQAFLISADETVEPHHAPPSSDIAATYDKPAVMKIIAEERKAEASDCITPFTAQSDLASLAQKLWLEMKDKTNDKFPMTDSGYLKLYQLSKPKLDREYDVLLLDEAQDAAPVMADIVLSQVGCAKILVGDPHQEIYSFMGAKNAMESVLRTVNKKQITQRRLSRSFRFGVEIASVANSLLRLKGETAPVLGAAIDWRDDVGFSAVGSSNADTNANNSIDSSKSSVIADRLIFETETSAVKIVIDHRAVLEAHTPVFDKAQNRWISKRLRNGNKHAPKQLTVLCRSNASLFEAAEIVMSFPGAKLGVVGGLESLKLDQLMDVFRLAHYTDEETLHEISDKYVMTFARKELTYIQDLREKGQQFNRNARDSLQNLKQASTLSDDKDMATRIGIVKRLGHRLPDLIHNLRKNSLVQKSHASAHFLLSTAHKSKGLEYDSVLLWNDFVDVHEIAKVRDTYQTHVVSEFGLEINHVASDEINLLYVAATRAKKELFLPQSLGELHGSYPGARNLFAHYAGVDETGRAIQGGPGAVVALRAFVELGNGNAFGSSSWNKLASSDTVQMGARARFEAGISTSRLACSVCEESALARVKDGSSSSNKNHVGMALVGGRVKNTCVAYVDPEGEFVNHPFTRIIDSDFHVAMTRTWWGDYQDLTSESDREAFQKLAVDTIKNSEKFGFNTAQTNAGAWERFVCPTCVQNESELKRQNGFSDFTATEHASAWEVLETCAAEMRARGE